MTSDDRNGYTANSSEDETTELYQHSASSKQKDNLDAQ